MTSLTTKSDSSQPAAETASRLFDNWFDPIETEIQEPLMVAGLRDHRGRPPDVEDRFAFVLHDPFALRDVDLTIEHPNRDLALLDMGDDVAFRTKMAFEHLELTIIQALEPVIVNKLHGVGDPLPIIERGSLFREIVIWIVGVLEIGGGLVLVRWEHVKRLGFGKVVAQRADGDDGFPAFVGVERIPTAADLFSLVRVLFIADGPINPFLARVAKRRVVQAHHQLQPFVLLAEIARIKAGEDGFGLLLVKLATGR